MALMRINKEASLGAFVPLNTATKTQKKEHGIYTGPRVREKNEALPNQIDIMNRDTWKPDASNSSWCVRPGAFDFKNIKSRGGSV